eukprot:scaffold77814_cov17-Prasinocladus_malaysianus.AAC.1
MTASASFQYLNVPGQENATKICCKPRKPCKYYQVPAMHKYVMVQNHAVHLRLERQPCPNMWHYLWAPNQAVFNLIMKYGSRRWANRYRGKA